MCECCFLLLRVVFRGLYNEHTHDVSSNTMDVADTKLQFTISNVCIPFVPFDEIIPGGFFLLLLLCCCWSVWPLLSFWCFRSLMCCIYTLVCFVSVLLYACMCITSMSWAAAAVWRNSLLIHDRLNALPYCVQVRYCYIIYFFWFSVVCRAV